MVDIRVVGRVQGVGFRACAQDRALELGLCGWVRNTPDRDVELLVGGYADDVEKMIAWCHQGPPMARVEHVYVQEHALAMEENDFRIAGW